MADITLSNGTVITEAELATIASAVKQLIAKESKEPSQYEEVTSLAGLTTLPALLQSGSSFRLVRAAVELLKGADAKEIQLRLSETAIQWRHDGEETWQDLITVAEIQEPAKEATDAANAAATKATEEAAKAAEATTNANAATTSANNAAKSANEAATSANEAATAANTAADRVDESILDVSIEKQAALEAANAANAAADAANTATSKANTATANANQATTEANNAASAAMNAATDANVVTKQAVSATTAANKAAFYATEIADHQPIIGEDGYWYRWDSANDVYVKTDDYAKGGADYPVFGLDDETMNVTVSSEISNDRYAVNEEGILVVLF